MNKIQMQETKIKSVKVLQSYPVLKLRTSYNEKNKIYFKIYTDDNIWTNFCVKDKLDRLRSVLNTDSRENIELYTWEVYTKHYTHTIEQLNYQQGYFYYTNASLNIKVELTEENRVILQNYTQRLETYYAERGCCSCILF